jgi:hypothetical protein
MHEVSIRVHRDKPVLDTFPVYSGLKQGMGSYPHYNLIFLYNMPPVKSVEL